jgi:two-component system sensor histidine kinase BaeS
VSFPRTSAVGHGQEPRLPLPRARTASWATRPTRTKAEACVDRARRAQLDPYVAPVAELFLGGGDTTVPRFDVSPANKAKVVGAAPAVLALTVLVTAVVATRLVRPLRALTEAAQQPPELHVRVPVKTRDETGILAEAFNDLTERRERMEAQRKAMVSDIAHELRSPAHQHPRLAGGHPRRLRRTRPRTARLPARRGDGPPAGHRRPPGPRGRRRRHPAPAPRTRPRRGPRRPGRRRTPRLRRHGRGRPPPARRTTPSGWTRIRSVCARCSATSCPTRCATRRPTAPSPLTAWRDGDDIVLTVADTGIGIAPEDLPSTSSNGSGAPTSPAAAAPEAAAWACPSCVNSSRPTAVR